MATLSRSDRFFLLVMALLVLGVVASWYFLNSNSPRFKRESYLVLFEEIGTLRRGDPVAVNGLPSGEIQKVRLTGDGLVEVQFGVLETVFVPEDSRFKIVNAGLVGERILEITPGRSSQKLSGDHPVHGEYDPGATRLAVTAKKALLEADSLFSELYAAYDATLGVRQRERVACLGKRLQIELKRTALLGTAVSDSLNLAFDRLQKGGEAWEALWENSGESRQKMGSHLATIGKQGGELGQSIGRLGDGLERLSERLSQESDGSLAQFLQNPSFTTEIESLSHHGQQLLKALSK